MYAPNTAMHLILHSFFFHYSMCANTVLGGILRNICSLGITHRLCGLTDHVFEPSLTVL